MTCLVRIYQGAVIRWQFGGLYSHLPGGLRLKNYCPAAGNHKFSSRFLVFVYVCVTHSNKVKRLKTEPSKLVLLSF